MASKHWLLGSGLVLVVCSLVVLLSRLSLFEYVGFLCGVPFEWVWVWCLPFLALCMLFFYWRVSPSYLSTSLVVVSLSLFVFLVAELYGAYFFGCVFLVVVSGVCLAWSFWTPDHRDWCYIAAMVFLLVSGLLVYASTITPLRFFPEHCVSSDGLACQGFRVSVDDGALWVRIALPPAHSLIDGSKVLVGVVDEGRFCPSLSGYAVDLCRLLPHEGFVELSCVVPSDLVVGDVFSAFLLLPDDTQLSLRSLVE